MAENKGLISYFLECAGRQDDGGQTARLETFLKLLLTYTKDIKDSDEIVRAKTLAACTKAMCIHCRNGRMPTIQSYAGMGEKWEGPRWIHRTEGVGFGDLEVCGANEIRSLQTRSFVLERHDIQIRKEMLAVVILYLAPFRQKLDELLCDEDLTEEKLREASEGILPRLADTIRRLPQLRAPLSEAEKILEQEANP